MPGLGAHVVECRVSIVGIRIMIREDIPITVLRLRTLWERSPVATSQKAPW